MKYLTISEVEYTAHKLARELMSYDEPIPDFWTRFPNVLEQCLGAPRQTFNRRQLYRGIASKAAILFYLMIKNHPFQNGNKRIAVMSMLLFLYKNGKWIRLQDKDLYKFAVDVAESNPKEKDKILIGINKIIEHYLVGWDEIELSLSNKKN